MNQQWKKLTSLFLLLLFMAQSPLHASACACCTFHLILAEAVPSTKPVNLGCCNRRAPASAQSTPSCCVKSTLANSNDNSQVVSTRTCCGGGNDEAVPCESPGDCDCCAQAPDFAFPNAEHSTGQTFLVGYLTYGALPVLAAPQIITTASSQRVLPLPLSRRLAMISFWRN
jgi:hypothetical protein